MSTPSFSPPASPHAAEASHASTGSGADEDYSLRSGEPSFAQDDDDAIADLSLSSYGSPSADSLADASHGEVEARALEFLASSPPTSDSAALASAFDALDDLPRTVPTLPADQLDGHSKAVDFLRKKLDDAERDDWMFSTPSAFSPPPVLGLRGSGERDDDSEAMGDALPWADRAFNLERYTAGGVAVDTAWSAEGPFVDHEPPRFGEGDWGMGT
ncbi:hypothetical protein JCM6882_002445 [Rhodosporidiobolus microsporus]